MRTKELFGNWINTIQTFPTSHILLFIISILLILQNEGVINLNIELNISMILTFILSCYGPLFTIHKNSKQNKLINWVLQIGSIILGFAYYIILCHINLENSTYSEGLLYVGILPLSLLVLISIIAIIHNQNEQKIRFSIQSLFISIIFGVIAGAILGGGISGALASTETLFDININNDLYTDIRIIFGILFTGSFTFNYYLTLTRNINNDSNFTIKASRLRKIFGLYIFLPLVSIYLIIFIIYLLKILITGIWPRGIIIGLGIGYFILGIICLYLIYPDKNKFKEIINKTLLTSFIIIAIMMIGAITKRINQYGNTINRCFICYIISFIIIFSTLSLIFKNKKLLIFISSLGILSFVAIYGRPINVSNISFNSQVKRLKNITTQNNISLPLIQGSLQNIDEKATRKIMGALDELIKNYNKDKIIDKIINYNYEDNYRSSRQQIKEFLGYNPYYNDYYPITYKYYNYQQSDMPINISGYSKIFNFDGNYIINNKILELNIDNQKYIIDLTNYLDELKNKSEIFNKNNKENIITITPALTLEVENYKLIINGFSFQENLDEGIIDFNNIQGYILIK